MLKNFNDDYFINKGINHTGIIFFLQRCLEIFEPRTLDTYQYSITNIVVGMREYIDVIDKTLDGSFLTTDNIDACRMELLRIINEDDIIDKHLKDLSNRLKWHLGNSIKKDERAKLLRAKSEINYALKLIEPNYQQWLMNELYDDINNINYTSIQSHIKILASFCIYDGWTPYGISNLINRIFLSNHDNFDFNNCWNKLTNELKIDQSFIVYINLRLDAKGRSTTDSEITELITQIGIPIYNYDEIINRHSEIDKANLPAKREKRYMLFSTDAKDVRAAALKSVNLLNTKITILAFYNKISSWSLTDLDGFVIAESNCYIWRFKIDDIFKTFLFLDTSNKVFENAMEVYSNDEKFKSINSALKGVFNYINISLVSVFPEEKFMNLWIALESFMRTGQYSNIISHIKEVLPAIVSKRYIYRLIRNFGEDCLRCNVEMILTDGKIELNEEHKLNMVKQIIKAIRDESSYNEMKQLCSKNTLLLFRLEELSNLLKDNITIITKIKKYYETVSWHIQRLYRIRNEIAHSALKENHYLVTYIEHLYGYLSILLAEIIFVSSEKGFEKLDEIFPYLKDNYDAFESILQGKKVTIEDFQLEDGIINYI